MDTEEMYRRGVADAERGEPNPFYYQHYYHYRRGYDRARRRLPGLAGAGLAARWRLPLLAAVVAGCIYGVYSLLVRPAAAPPTPVAAAVSTATAAPTAPPARTPIFPTATVAPTPTPLALRVGALAAITNTSGRPPRGRESAGLSAPIRAGFPEGERVRILEGPVAADGFTWWRVEGPSGAGWSAERSADGLVWLTPIAE